MQSQKYSDMVRHMKPQGNADQGMRIISYLISGLLFYGGLGWLADYVFSTGFWFPTGLILGAVSGMYLVIKRYGYDETEFQADSRSN